MSSEEVRDACADALEARLAAFETEAPPVAGYSAVSVRSRPWRSPSEGCCSRGPLAGDAVSDELLGACRKWALPERDDEATPARRR